MFAAAWPSPDGAKSDNRARPWGRARLCVTLGPCRLEIPDGMDARLCKVDRLINGALV